MAKNSYTYQEILLGMLVNYTKIVKLDKYVTDLSNQIKLTLSMTVPLALWLHFGVLSQLYCQTISLVVDNPFCDLLYVSCVSPTPLFVIGCWHYVPVLAAGSIIHSYLL